MGRLVPVVRGGAIAAAGLAQLLSSHAVAAVTPGGRSPSVADIVQVVEIGSLSASPDGTKVAFRTEQARLDRNSYLLTWHVAQLDSGAVAAVGAGGAPLYTDPGLIPSEPAVWAPDSRAFFYRALVDDAIGVWRAEVDGAPARLVFRDDADVESFTADGPRARLVVGPSRDAVRAAEQQEYDDGILVDATVALNQNLVRSGLVNGRLATQRLRGQWFTRVGLLSDAPRHQRTLDLQSIVVGPPEPPPPPGPALQLGVDPGISVRSATGALVRAVRVGNVTNVEMSPAAGPTVRCAAPVCREHVVALAWRPGTGQVLLTVQDRHIGQSLHLWDPATGEVRTVASSEGYLSGAHDGQSPCAVTRVAAVCVSASAVSPPRLERIDLDTGARAVLFDPNASLRQERMPSVERLAWSTPEGDSFTGILLLPPEGPRTRLPLFVDYYQCGGFLSGGVGDELPFLPLAGAGMAVACINLPPYAGVEDFLGRYPQGLRAVRSLVAMLDARGVVDRARVGMAGLSFGSEVTMWTLLHSNLLAAAAMASTQIEPTYYWYNSVRGRPQPEVIRRFWGLPAPDESPAAWRRDTAAMNIDRIRVPLLMQLPEQEARNVIELYSKLSRSTIPTELYAFPDSAHIKVQPRQRLAAHQRYLDWFRYWLQNYTDPDPAKAEQYRRWNALAARWHQGSAPPRPQP